MKIERVFFAVFLCASLAFSQRIISLAPSVTNQLIALGADSLLIAKTSFCLSGDNEKGNVKIIGDVINVSGESVIALKPDAVFAGGLTNKSLIAKLRNSNVNVFVTNDPKNYEELRGNFAKIAEIAGAAHKADSILSFTDAEYSRIKERNETLKNRAKIFIQLSANPIYTVMKNTLGNEMIEAAGGKNAFELDGGALVSREAVVAADPDVIIVAQMEKLSLKEVENWMRFKEISAVKANNVHIFDGYAIGSPTPLSFIETVEKIRAFIR